VTYYNTGGIPGIPERRLIAPIGVDPADPTNVVYATASGTSFATAFVTGAAAAFRSTRPDWPSPSVPLQEIPTRFMQELATRSERDGTTPAGIPRLAAFDLVSPQPMNRLRAPDIVDDGGFPYRRSLGGGDMAAVLGNWGPVGPGYLVTADADDDGVITGGDLVPVLGSWGVIDP
jgi:subtilisin family serine protease